MCQVFDLTTLSTSYITMRRRQMDKHDAIVEHWRNHNDRGNSRHSVATRVSVTVLQIPNGLDWG